MRSINNEKGLPRREYWQELVSQQEQSGLSVYAFCKQRDVTEASFYNWRKQLRNNTGVGFALVDAQGKADKPKAPVELVLATGDRVQIAPGADAETVRMVIGVLRERS
jgi:transposase-like protein